MRFLIEKLQTKRTLSLGLVGALISFSLLQCTAAPRVQVGADVLLAKHLDILKGKRVGIITNQTGRISNGEFLVDVLVEREIQVTALFGPEHGIRGDVAAGEKISDMKDPKTGIPVYSLYGKTRKPTVEMLKDVDILVYDIQDVGTRFYTYISTMGLAMEAAAESSIPFVVLDRPNPLGGERVDGPIMSDTLRSFVGMFPIPIIYGLTCGELAAMINGEAWLAGRIKADLTIIRCEGWTRSMTWPEVGRAWIPPSPNIPTDSSALVYAGTCLIEGTNLSEGRGTSRPFQTIGAPFIDGNLLAALMSERDLPGARFSPISFVPSTSKFKNEECHGVFIEVTDWKEFDPIIAVLTLMQEVVEKYQDQIKLNPSSLGRLSGSPGLYDVLNRSGSITDLRNAWRENARSFTYASEPYRLYK